MKKKYGFGFRRAVSAQLEQFDSFAKVHDFIELTLWDNGEGFDVRIDSYEIKNFSLNWGEYDAIRKLVKQLDKSDNFKNLKK